VTFCYAPVSHKFTIYNHIISVSLKQTPNYGGEWGEEEDEDWRWSEIVVQD
jgi:hypothetical protein